jgi:hypothetical protein
MMHDAAAALTRYGAAASNCRLQLAYDIIRYSAALVQLQPPDMLRQQMVATCATP